MKQASPGGWRSQKKFQLPDLEEGRGKRERAEEDRNRWEQDEKDQNKEGRQKPELRRGGRVSDTRKPRAGQGALLGLQDNPTEAHWVGEIFQDFCLEKKFKVLVHSSGPSRSVALFSRREKLGHDSRLIGMVGVDIIEVAVGFQKKGHACWCCTFQFLNIGGAIISLTEAETSSLNIPGLEESLSLKRWSWFQGAFFPKDWSS